MPLCRQAKLYAWTLHGYLKGQCCRGQSCTVIGRPSSDQIDKKWPWQQPGSATAGRCGDDHPRDQLGPTSLGSHACRAFPWMEIIVPQQSSGTLDSRLVENQHCVLNSSHSKSSSCPWLHWPLL